MHEYMEKNDFKVGDSNLVIENSEFFSGGRYCRSSNFARELFGTEYLEVYGLDHSNGRYAVLTSGMNAISCIMTNIVRNNPDKIIVYGSELYCDTPRTIRYLGCASKSVDVRNSEEILKYFEQNGENISLFFIESCTNPSGQMFDFELIPKLKEYSPGCIFCVDNTWCTGLGFNPFKYGVDIIVESTTKYISGGKCIGGVILAVKRNGEENTSGLMDEIDKWIRVFGQFVGKDHCHIFRMGLKTMQERLRKTSELAIRLAIYLENRDDVNRVMYPTLPSHPTYSLAKKVLKLNPGCICFHLQHNLSNKKVLKKIKSIEGEDLILLETSYGSKYCKLDPWPKTKNSAFYEPGSEPKKGVWLRLAVGSESEFDSAVEKLDRTLKYIAKDEINKS